MSEDIDIIMFALPRWDGPYSSTAYSLAKEFSKKNRVFYIDNPVTIKYYLLNRNTPEIRKRKPALFFGADRYTKVSENLTVVVPKLVLPVNFLSPGRIYDFFAGINDRSLHRMLKKMLQDFSISNYIFINSFNPFYLAKLPPYFEPKLFIYHTVDDISQSNHISKHGPTLEGEIIKNADLTITTSKELKRRMDLFSKNVYCVPNAADVSLFKTSLEGNFSKPKDLDGITKPIVIYTGNIDPRIDFELLIHAVKSHGDKMFVMVGPTPIDKILLDELKSFSNIVFTGKKDITELPVYLHFAQCAIIPFKCNQLTKSIYPLKVNEYLASGKPVVSTAFSDDIVDFQDVIEICTDPADFSEGITRALKDHSSERQINRVHVAESNTWEARVKQFWQIVEKYSHKSLSNQ